MQATYVSICIMFNTVPVVTLLLYTCYVHLCIVLCSHFSH